jgi:hypothetical protein
MGGCGHGMERSGDPSLTEGEATEVIHSFLDEAMSAGQERTLRWLTERTGAPFEGGLTYAQARSAIRRHVASRGLRSA